MSRRILTGKKSRDFYFHPLVVTSSGFVVQYDRATFRYTAIQSGGNYNSFAPMPRLRFGVENRVKLTFESSKPLHAPNTWFEIESLERVGALNILIGYMKDGTHQSIYYQGGVGLWMTRIHVEYL